MTYSASLRPLEEADLDMLLQWRNALEVRSYMYTQHLIGESEHYQWFQCAQQNSQRHLLIAEYDNQPFGFVNIQLMDLLAERAEWGFYLSPNAPRGSGLALGKAALEYAFIRLDLHKLCGEALASNMRSRIFHERLGFRQESCLRDHHFDGHVYRDVIGYGLLHGEWKTL